MTEQSANLLQQVLALPPEEREQFADSIYESLSEESPQQIAQAWDGEIQRRIEEIDRGGVELVPGEQMLSEARAKARRRKHFDSTRKHGLSTCRRLTGTANAAKMPAVGL